MLQDSQKHHIVIEELADISLGASQIYGDILKKVQEKSFNYDTAESELEEEGRKSNDTSSFRFQEDYTDRQD